MKIISFITEKGGVGKTTGAREIAGMLALNYNKKVLMIDCDFQENLSNSFSYENTENKNIYNAFVNKDLKSNIVEIEKNIDLIPGCLEIKDLDTVLEVKIDNDFFFKKELPKLDYDVVVIDCRPDMKLIERNALKASDYVITPMEPHHFSMKGFDLVERFIKGVKTDLNTPFIHLGYLSRVPIDKAFTERLEGIKDQYSDVLLKTNIRENTKLKECSMDGYFIGEYSPTCNGSKDFKKLTEELIERWQRNHQE